MFASTFRQAAQKIRHAPGLERLNPLWDRVRPAYMSALAALCGGRGVELTIAGCAMSLNPRFACADWESIERDSYDRFVKTVRPGDIVYDVGASIGTYTLLALQKSAPNGRVVAYEPVDFVRNCLVDHLHWNNANGRAIVRPVCCGSENRDVALYFREAEMIGNSGLAPIPGGQTTIVPMRSLDSEVSSLGLVPTIIKIDVEGWEFEVLRGGESTLKRYGPTLFLSLHPDVLADSNVTPEHVREWLESRGYSLEFIAADHEMHVVARLKPGASSVR